MIIENGQLNMDELNRLYRIPRPFEPGEESFWDDPHIARGMLRAHLDPDVDAASRPPEFIDASVRWLLDTMKLRAGDRVLDLGCGPGLYCERLARRGLAITGIDISQASIDCAKKRARDGDLGIDYRVGDYHQLPLGHSYRAIFSIYGQFAVDPPEMRRHLLGRIRRALLGDGMVALDVPTRRHFPEGGGEGRWSVHGDGGFWRPEPYLLLQRNLDYPKDRAFLNQYVVIGAEGYVRTYNVWSAYYTAEEIATALTDAGFSVEEIRGDLAGSPLRPGDEWIAVVASAPA